MTEFGAVGMIDLQVETIEGAEAAFQQEVGPVEIPIETTPPSQRSFGGGMGGAAGDMMSLDQQRNQYLETIVDELQDDNNGGGGGMLSGLAGGLSSFLGGSAGAGGSLLAGGALGTAGLIGGGLAGAGALIGGSRYALGQGVFGEEGRNALGSRMQFEGAEGARNMADDPLGAVGTSIKNQLDPTGLGETAIRKGLNSTQIDEQIVSGFERGVSQLSQGEYPEPPDPLEGAEWPDVPEPQGGTDYWPQLPEPGTTQDFWPDLPELPEPSWLSALEDLTGDGGQPSRPGRQAERPRIQSDTRSPPGIPSPVGPDIDGILQRLDTIERALNGGFGGP